MGFSKAVIAVVVVLAGIANAQDTFLSEPVVSWAQVFLPMADNNGLVMSSDSAVLYATSSDGTVGAINPTDGSVLWTYQPPGSGPLANNGEVSFSADGSALYYAVSEGETCNVISLAHPSGNVNWISTTLTGACEGTPYGTSDGNNVFVISNSGTGTVGHFTVLDSTGSVFFTQEDTFGPYSPMGFYADPFPGGKYPLGQFNPNSIAIWGYKPTPTATDGEDGASFGFQMPATASGASPQVIILNEDVRWRATAPPVLAAQGQQLHWFVTRSNIRSWVNSAFHISADGSWEFNRGIPSFRAAPYSPALDNLDSPSIICGGSATNEISCSNSDDITAGPIWLTDISPGLIFADPLFSTNGDRVYWADDDGIIRSVDPLTGFEFWIAPTNVQLLANTELSEDGAYVYFADVTGNIVAWQVAVSTMPSVPTPTPPTPAPVTLTPAPVTPTPAPVTPTAAPITQTPAPVTSTPAPVTPTPAPVTPTAAPVTPTPAPVTLTPAPVTPTPAPVTPTAAPITPTPAPVTPTPAPVTPTQAPVTPTAAPITPTPAPITSTPAPVTTTRPPTDPPAFVSLTPSEYGGCIEVGGSVDEKVTLEECKPENASQQFRFDGNLVRSALGDNKCLQVGSSNANVRDGKFLRLYPCDADNDRQQFTWTSPDGPLKLKDYPEFCIVFRGDTANIGDDPIIAKTCANASMKGGWEVYQGSRRLRNM